MTHVVFASHLQRFVSCPEHDVEAGTVRAPLARIFVDNPRLRDYILDDQGGLRKHVILFIDGRRTRDLGEEVSAGSEIHVLQRAPGDRLDHRGSLGVDERRRLLAGHQRAPAADLLPAFFPSAIADSYVIDCKPPPRNRRAHLCSARGPNRTSPDAQAKI